MSEKPRLYHFGRQKNRPPTKGQKIPPEQKMFKTLQQNIDTSTLPLLPYSKEETWKMDHLLDLLLELQHKAALRLHELHPNEKYSECHSRALELLIAAIPQLTYPSKHSRSGEVRLLIHPTIAQEIIYLLLEKNLQSPP